MVLKRNQNIVLIGFMGSGKSAAGKMLAKKSNMKFIDTDACIEKREGKTVSEIFKRYGENYFRDKESEIIKEASEQKNAVISAGGGAVLRKENVNALKKAGIIVWLKAEPETIVKRVGSTKNRPLLSYKGNKEEDVWLLLKKRTPYYRSAHDVAVRTDGRTITQVVEEIVRRVRGVKESRVKGESLKFEV